MARITFDVNLDVVSSVIRDILKVPLASLRWAPAAIGHRIADHNHRKLLRDVFSIRDTVLLWPGATHPHFPDRVHPDNRDAANDVHSLLSGMKVAQVAREIEEEPGTQIVFGSPRSTNELTSVLGLVADPAANPRNADVPFKLRYAFGGWSGLGLHARRFIDGQEVDFPCGAVYQLGRRTVVCDEPTVADGWLISDVVLITCLPNVLDDVSYSTGKRLISLAGVTGVGTKAATTVLRDVAFLDEIKRTTSGAPGFQLLIRVPKVENDHPNQRSIAPVLELANIEDIALIDLNEKRVKAWMKRRRVYRYRNTPGPEPGRHRRSDHRSF